MKKTLFALAAAGLFAGVANAQSSVTIYGIADTGIVKETGSDVQMGNNHESRIGFRGSEDLGNGYKALFMIEKRINLNDGTNLGEVDWDGGANVGIGGPFGTVRLGRVDEIPTETIRKLDPFYNDSIANMPYSTQRSSRISNTIRYDSPSLSGLVLTGTYSLGKNTKGSDATNAFVQAGADNDGYAAAAVYDNGPITLLGAWSRLTDSNDSYRWDVGGAYSWGNLRLSLAYEKTKDKGWYDGGKSNSGIADSTLINGVAATMNSWILGLNYKLGPGTLKASFNYVKLKNVSGVSAADGGNYWANNSSADLKQYGLGYIYDLSKRTSLYGILAYTDFENEAISNFFRGSGFNNDSVTGVQVGITHKF